jgi:hypothetical protein
MVKMKVFLKKYYRIPKLKKAKVFLILKRGEGKKMANGSTVRWSTVRW